MKHAVGDDARNTRSSSLALPILGVAIAIAGTTTMGATGLMEWNRLCVFRFRHKNERARYSRHCNLRSWDRHSRLN